MVWQKVSSAVWVLCPWSFLLLCQPLLIFHNFTVWGAKRGSNFMPLSGWCEQIQARIFQWTATWRSQNVPLKIGTCAYQTFIWSTSGLSFLFLCAHMNILHFEVPMLLPKLFQSQFKTQSHLGFRKLWTEHKMSRVLPLGSKNVISSRKGKVYLMP